MVPSSCLFALWKILAGVVCLTASLHDNLLSGFHDLVITLYHGSKSNYLCIPLTGPPWASPVCLKHSTVTGDPCPDRVDSLVKEINHIQEKITDNYKSPSARWDRYIELRKDIIVILAKSGGQKRDQMCWDLKNESYAGKVRRRRKAFLHKILCPFLCPDLHQFGLRSSVRILLKQSVQRPWGYRTN